VKCALLRGILPLLFVVASTAAAQDPISSAPSKPQPFDAGKPTEISMKRASSTTIDLRKLPQTAPIKRERPELEEPDITRVELPGGPPAVSTPVLQPGRSAPAPPTTVNFDGLDFATWGAGHPPDPNGDVGPTYFIETINTSIGIYPKSGGAPVAAFTFDTLMSQGHFGNLCDTNNFGDPVVLYDTFEDRWVITDFAFTLDGSGNVINPPGSFQCFAVSKTGDPVLGGWNFYSINTAGGLGDYPKFGIWPDGLYMSANMFNYSGGAYQNPRVYAFNKAQMYAGSPTVQVVTLNAPSADFTILPSNARLQAGTPPPGTPNYYVSTEEFLNALTVYKFHVDWNSISLSTFTGPDTPLASTSWPNANVPNAPSLGGNALDVLQIRAMMQNQYTNLGGAESLWTAHTVRRGDTTGFAAPRWYQVNVTGGTVAANLPQAATWDPDGANVIYRFVPSLALDRAGNMALGYSTSSSTTKPAIKYAGRLSSDPVNTLGQTEQLLIQGTGTQLGNCGSSACLRWGDYSAMTLDPNGCTFWYTNMYFVADGLNFQTRVGSFAFPSCTPVGAGGTLSGTVTATVGGASISGATITFGSRTTTTDGSGFYQFLTVPAGTYPSITASAPGYNTATATSIVVADSATTTQDFSLGLAPTNACLTDTTQADFQTGVATNVDLTTSPGDVILLNAPTLDQSNTAGTTTGTSFSTASWGGQTFIPAVTGQLVQVTVPLFCNGCTGTTPNLTLSVRATSGGLPTGGDLATATLPGFSSGAGISYTVSFGSPATLTSGTQYALILRPVANPSAGGYFWIRSSPSTYANGQRVISIDNGATFTADSTRDFNFKTYMRTGFTASGDLVSSVKDSNPPIGFTPTWTTLSWTASTPAGTALQFQVAGSNSVFGPFTFVGPDTTAGTFFTTSGASLSQFNGFRYLKYRAYLSTTDSTVTPTLNDVTVCFCDTPPTPTITPGGPTTFCAGNSVTLTSSSATGNQWYVGGIAIGGATNQAYIAIASGNYTVTVTTSGCTSAPSTATAVTVNPIPATPTITPGGPTTFCAGNSVTLTSSSATGNQWYLGGIAIGGATSPTYMASASGNYTVTVTALGCTSAASAITTVTVNPIPATPTIGAGGPTTFCAGGSVTLTSSSATGNQWYVGGIAIGGATNQTYHATASGNYTVIVTTLGCPSAPSVATPVTVNPIPATPTIGAGGPTTFCAGGSVTLTSSSATGNQWYLGGIAIGGATSPTYMASASGNYTVIVTTLGCPSSPSAATTITVNPVPATPVVTAPTTVGAGSPNRTAGVPAHAGSTYAWGITNGTITAGQGTDQITFTAGTAGTPLTLSVTETAVSGCVSAPGTTTVTVLAAGSSVLFYTATPCRQLDTRSGSPITPGGTLTVTLTGAPCGIPSSATSVSVNAAVTQEAGSGHLTIYPADKTQPLVSNISFNAGQTRANNSVLSLSSDGTGRVNVVNGSGGTVHVVIDVNGYFQ
jgi:hypothetical protein